MKKLFAAALLMTAFAAPAFAADTPATPAAPAPAAAPAADAKPAAKPMKMMHRAKMKPMAMKPTKASAVKPALEPSTDKLNQQQLDGLKKS